MQIEIKTPPEEALYVICSEMIQSMTSLNREKNDKFLLQFIENPVEEQDLQKEIWEALSPGEFDCFRKVLSTLHFSPQVQ